MGSGALGDRVRGGGVGVATSVHGRVKSMTLVSRSGLEDFELPLRIREQLVRSGFCSIDASLRFAAVELDLWWDSPSLHWSSKSDGEARHFIQFLVWADSTLSQVDKAVRRTGDQVLIKSWSILGEDPLRRKFRALRNEGLKEARDQAPWIPERQEGSKVLEFRRLGSAGDSDTYPRFDSLQYLAWIRDAALPHVMKAIDLEVLGPEPFDTDLPIEDQMAFPGIDPWTSSAEPEVAALRAWRGTPPVSH